VKDRTTWSEWTTELPTQTNLYQEAWYCNGTNDYYAWRHKICLVSTSTLPANQVKSWSSSTPGI